MDYKEGTTLRTLSTSELIISKGVIIGGLLAENALVSTRNSSGKERAADITAEILKTSQGKIGTITKPTGDIAFLAEKGGHGTALARSPSSTSEAII